jgi:branched-chain amino acid transport system substrate-binding protein
MSEKGGIMRRFTLLCIAVLFLQASTAPAQEPLKLGFIFVMSGRIGFIGQIARQGVEFALDEINQSGGIEGRQLVGLFENSNRDPQTASKAFTKLVTKEGVDAVIGVLTDEIAPAMAKLAEEHRTPLIITGAQTQVVTGKECNHYTFRICPNSLQTSKIGAILAGRTKAKLWTAVASDNAASRELWMQFKNDLLDIQPSVSFVEGKGLEFVNSLSAHWKNSVQAVKKSGAEGVFVYLYGGDFIDFVKEGNKVGLFDGTREFVAVMGSLAELLGLGRSMPKGIWWSSPYWFQASRSPANRRFVEGYETSYGVPPSWQAHFGYGGVKAYVAAVKKAGTTNPQAVVKALEGMTLNLPVGKVTIRAKDHQAIMHAMAGRTGRISVTQRKRSFRGLSSMILFRTKEFVTPEGDVDCRMKKD